MKAPGVEIKSEEYLFRPPIPHEATPKMEDEHNVFRNKINGVVIRYVVESSSIQVTVEGNLAQPAVDAVTSDLVRKLSRLENTNFVLNQL